MKAILRHTYGPPDVLKLEEIEKPSPKDNEVLIKVQAASVNAADWHLLRGTPYFARLTFGLFKPKNKIIGADFAGTVEAIGKDVAQFKPGDEVYGDISTAGFGTFAEYICVPEKVAMTPKPGNLSLEDAAAVPLAAITALQGVRQGKIEPGQKVLVNGASGGVGTFAVQLVKAFGAEVTTVCSTGKIDQARLLGADHVIDYTKEDFTKSETKYDRIIDVVGNRHLREYRRALTPKGICVIIGFTRVGLLFEHMLRGPLSSRVSSRKVTLMGTAQPNKQDLLEIKALIEGGQLTPTIEKRYPLSEASDAVHYVDEGHAKGKVVIVMV